MSESQSWVTSRAQEMFQKSVPENWNPERPYPDDHHDSRHNPQVISEVIRKAILSCLDLNLNLAWNSSKLYQLLLAFGIERAAVC